MEGNKNINIVSPGTMFLSDFCVIEAESRAQKTNRVRPGRGIGVLFSPSSLVCSSLLCWCVFNVCQRITLVSVIDIVHSRSMKGACMLSQHLCCLWIAKELVYNAWATADPRACAWSSSEQPWFLWRLQETSPDHLSQPVTLQWWYLSSGLWRFLRRVAGRQRAAGQELSSTDANRKRTDFTVRHTSRTNPPSEIFRGEGVSDAMGQHLQT